MDDLGERINSILNDPGAMDKIAGMAKSIMGGEARQERSAPLSDELGIDPAMLGRIAGILQKSGGKSEKRALLEAMKPYLSEKRRAKMDRAVKLAGLASIAGAALEEFGDKDDV